MKKFFLQLMALVICLPLAENLYAQEPHTWIFEGQVIFGKTIPVSNLTVRAKKSKASAVTDSIGRFAIEVLENDKIMIRSKPFESKILAVNESNPPDPMIVLNLMNDGTGVDIAVGYGYIPDAMRTDAVQYVRTHSRYENYQNIWQIIQEKFNNITINDGCVVVRGLSSINGDNCAMFVVDGNPVDNVDYILPTDIKEISLLKGGSATIYGCRGANGVFLINTKRGNE